jgi:sister chromatid cohesion protein PDS5
VNYIIPQLADPSSAYNAQHLYVLKSLAGVQSIALITDLDRPEQLILSLFTSCFDIVSGSAKISTGEEVTKAVEGYLTQILVQVIDESSSISTAITDVIIAQFMRVDPGTEEHHGAKKKNAEAHDGSQSNLLQKIYPRAYEMAKAICAAVPEKMTTYISQYFNNVIVDASEPSQRTSLSTKAHGRRGSIGEADDDAKDIRELSKAHRLIRELWRACPDVLQHVIPQVEAELSAESASLRLIATETLGDVAAGIGVTGCPPPIHPDPAAYPPQTLANPTPSIVQTNVLQTPMSPKPFAQVHATAYESFLSRKQDKAPSVRAAWATSAGRILLTSAGGIGFAEGQEQKLQGGLAQLLADADEKVRLAAIKAVGAFGLADVISKLASHGSISSPGSILATLSDRVRDRKNIVREEAMRVLGRMWAAAAGEIQQGKEEIILGLGDAPSKLLDAFYVNDPEVHVLLDHVMFEYLLPLNYPPIKGKTPKSDNQKQAGKEKADNSQDEDGTDADLIRVRRILTTLKGLDDKAKRVFFGMQNRQTQLSRVMGQYLKACEEYNGGVVNKNEAEVQKELTKWIEAISKTLPDPTRVSTDLRKFAKLHDRRNYQLIRFCLNPESEYRTVVKAVKELTKRLQSRSTTSPSLDTITPILYRCSLLIYNRSHVPGIMRISRSDEMGLAEPAHELLRDMSSRTPEVLKTHVQELCKDLEFSAPSDSNAEESSAADMLKACAEFTRKFPAEVPRDRKFLIAMTNYALFSRSPRAAKHAVSIIMAGTEKKEMYAKELIQKATNDCTYQSPHFLTRLATISQINLLDPKAADAESDTIIRITTQDTLLKSRHPSSDPESYSWSPSPSPETLAKEWSLKCLVNFLRSHLDDDSSFAETATPIYAMLTRLIEQEGELSPLKDTPPAQKSHLRLTATRFLLKLCSKRRACEDLVTPRLFNTVALVAHDRLPEVRAGFTAQLKKYLGLDRLNYRWYTVLFLSAFEPEKQLKNNTIAWLRSRAQALSRKEQQAQAQSKGPGQGQAHQNITELILARLLSLLAHHPDFPETSSETFTTELLDFAQYILFYLLSISNEENLSLIFHVAQRVKQTQDAITGTVEASERLYVLSDLAQAVIRHFADLHPKWGHGGGSGGGSILQTWPGKLRLPVSLFRGLPSHEIAQKVAERNYLPEEVAEMLEGVVRAALRPGKGAKQPHHEGRKRKSENRGGGEDEDGDDDAGKRVKRSKKATATLPVRKASKSSATSGAAMKQVKTPRQSKKRKSNDEDDDGGDDMPSSGAASAPARKSSRKSSGRTTNYAEGDSDDDDEEMEKWDRIAEEKRKKAEKVGESEQEDEDVEEDEAAVDEPPTTNGHRRDGGEDGKENEDLEMKDHDQDHDDIDNDDDDGVTTSSSRQPSVTPTPLRRPQVNGTPSSATNTTSSPNKKKTRTSSTTTTTTKVITDAQSLKARSSSSSPKQSKALKPKPKPKTKDKTKVTVTMPLKKEKKTMTESAAEKADSGVNVRVTRRTKA